METDDIIYIAQIPFRPNHIKSGGEIKKMKNFLAKEKLAKDAYNCETNEDGSETLSQIFNNQLFENPKPVGLINLLIKATTYEKPNAIVLDFFAGSGTTGHAVFELNEKDEGDRTCILCQLNENLDSALENASGNAKTVVENQIALCKQYNRPHELSEITVERLRRIMSGECYDGTKDYKWIKENHSYGGNLDVYEISSVASFEATKGKTAFDVIDETLYGHQKFDNLQEKVDWVCSHFNNAQKMVENNADWQKRIKGE